MGLSVRTILYPSFRLANDAIRRAAIGDAPSYGAPSLRSDLLGEYRTTPLAYVEEQWGLWGDGRALVADIDRALLVFDLLERHSLRSSMGTAFQISDLIKRGFNKIKEIDLEAIDITVAEKNILELVRDYGARLEQEGLIELTDVLDAIKPYVPLDNVMIDSRTIIDEPLHSFFSACEIVKNIRGGFLAPDCELEIFRAEGDSVVDKMIFDECEDAVKGKRAKRIAVVGSSPNSQFLEMSDDLCDMGAICTKMSSAQISDTSFGKFFLGVCALLAMADEHGLSNVLETEARDWISVATDVALNKYSSIASFKRDEIASYAPEDLPEFLTGPLLNCVWRGNRTLNAADAVADLRVVSATFERIESVFSGKLDPFAALDSIKRIANVSFSDIEAAVEVSAIDAVVSLMGLIAKYRLPAYYAPLMIQHLAISDFETVAQSHIADELRTQGLGCESGDSRNAEIAFLSVSQAKNMPEASFDIVICSDVSDQLLNARSKADSTLEISKRFDVAIDDNAAEKARCAFASIAASARSKLICIFPAHDSDSKESFTSFCFDEMIEQSFDGAVSAKDLVEGKVDAGPGSKLQISFKDMGEEEIQSGVGRRFKSPDKELTFGRPIRGRLKKSALIERLSIAENDSGEPLPVISPSSIESYLDCPYKWFIDHVVGLEAIDESFSAIETGNFAHELLKRFYGHLQNERGSIFFRESETELIEELFLKTANVLLDEQFSKAPRSGRYVPVTIIEQKDTKELIESIFQSVLALNELPKDYELAASELRISPFGEQKQSVDYAGFLLNGTVDRADASQDSSFYVLDYKGSLKGREAGSDCFSMIENEDGSQKIDEQALPSHVQSLVYASVLVKLGILGERCRGAFYVSYKPSEGDPLASGSIEAGDEDLSELTNRKSLVTMPMDRFLELVEEAISSRLVNMRMSDISIDPTTKDACRFCNYANCVRRMA